MKCPKCGKELEIEKRKTGVGPDGNPVYNRYAVCHDCKKMWNLDRPKPKKPDIPAKPENKETKRIPSVTKSEGGAAPAPVKKRIRKDIARNPTPVKKPRAADVGQQGGLAKAQRKPASKPAARPAKRQPANEGVKGVPKDKGRAALDKGRADANKRQRYSNIPSAAVRSKHEKAVKENYTSMLSTDPSRAAANKRSLQEPEEKHVYRGFRVVLGIFAILCSGLFGYMAYLSDFKTISLSNLLSPVMIYVVLAGCMLLSGVVSLAMQKSNSVFAFLIPMLLSLSGTLFPFMSHSDIPLIKLYAIGCAVYTAILLVITITSRFAVSLDDDYEDSDDEMAYTSVKPTKRPRQGDGYDDDFYNDDDE